MEYGNKILPVIGLLGLFFWCLNFFYFYKKPEIYLPKNFLVKTTRKQLIPPHIKFTDIVTIKKK